MQRHKIHNKNNQGTVVSTWLQFISRDLFRCPIETITSTIVRKPPAECLKKSSLAPGLHDEALLPPECWKSDNEHKIDGLLILFQKCGWTVLDVSHRKINQIMVFLWVGATCLIPSWLVLSRTVGIDVRDKPTKNKSMVVAMCCLASGDDTMHKMGLGWCWCTRLIFLLQSHHRL